ncbi:MAG TPA: wax ester/triacylglycerol synthase family O-acyltransferase [Rubricoccaceae bacterium]|nr:wax ester/triacylglycerol synthase family O-acyltransferase [Rubricoccaceae bacterium]
MPTPMNAADVAWLRMETPTNPMTITGVMVLDAPMDRATLERLVEQRLLLFDRFRSYIDDPQGRVPRWTLESPFNLDAHLLPLQLPSPGGQSDLEAAVSELMSTPLDFSIAPWTIHLVERFGKGSALIVRIHHCVADGIALIHVLLSLADEHWDPTRIKGRREPAPLRQRVARTVKGALGETADLLTRPRHLGERLRTGGRVSRSLGHLLLMGRDSETVFKEGVTPRKRAAWSQPVALDTAKAVGRAAGAKVNDVLLAAATGALRRYLDARNEPTAGVEVRAAVPFNVRPPERAFELGNAFGLVFLALPVGVEDPVERLVVLKERMDAIKASEEPAVTYGILQSIGRAPRWAHRQVVRMFSSKASAVMTNVPGPTETVHLLGVPVGALMFWVPQAGDIGLGVSLISYAGTVRLGIAADANLVADPWALVRGFETEFADLARTFVGVPGR